MKRFLLILMGAALWTTGYGNNIRIEGDVRVMDSDVTGSTANVKIQLRWDNSWRDAFNYDAVYIFLKYKYDGTEEFWHHAYLEDAGHVVPGGFTWEVSKTSTTGANQNQGIFIYRSRKGFGNVSMDLQLKWNIAANPDKVLDRGMFTAGRIFISAMGIEMVYIPRGAFRIGDTESAKTFRNKEVTLPAAYDLIGTDAVDTCMSAVPLAANPPEFATNRMNDISADESNAWVGRGIQDPSGDFYDYWRVNFAVQGGVAIRNLAIESIPGHVPTAWELQGNNGSSVWMTVYRGTAADWAINSHRTYPCTKTIRINNETKYVNYRIWITETAVAPVIKNIAMSDKNVFDSTDNSVLITGMATKMGNRYGLYAGDQDSTSGWSGKLHAQYPNGYGAFYVMKYEITQEQYVAFLNKLTAVQQRLRTIGSDLESLPEGNYVFGTNRTTPTARNGIKLASIGSKSSVGVNDAPYVFANDLDPNTEYSQDGDGQTIACNFLNAGDMLAYADWCGLRPLTEMEFEKMSRRPYPFNAIRNEYVWNTAANYAQVGALDALHAGKRTERIQGTGNINAGGYLSGPIRVGALSAGAGRIQSGASFWGVMELGGNLSELYYNANSGGRLFRGTENNQHGDGKLALTGETDVTAQTWPVTNTAFALRGGNFSGTSAITRISDRSRNVNVFATNNAVYEQKDSTMGFRLGRTAPVLTMTAEVRLANGLTSASANAGDSICSGSDYVIEGAIPSEITGAYRVAWFMSSDQGDTWDHLEGEEDPSLKLTNLRNINTGDDIFKKYWYKRMIYSNQMDVVQTNPVCIWVINQKMEIDRLQDTVDVYDYSQGIRVQVPQQAEFRWTWLRENSSPVTIDVEYKVTTGKIERHFFKYTDFFVGSQYFGNQKILLEVTVMKKCSTVDTVRLFVKDYPVQRNNVNNDAAKTVNTDFHCGDILVDNEEAVGQHKKYRTIEIGGRCWFADNLNREVYTKPDEKSSDRCYSGLSANCDKYGRLYNFYAATLTTYAQRTTSTEGVQGICPKGWYLPTNTDWINLYAALGKTVTSSSSSADGKEIKSSLNDWTYKNVEANIGENRKRFSGLPAGGYFYTYSGSYATDAGINSRAGYGDLGERAWWWTSTTTGGTYVYWHASNNNYIMRYVPSYVRMDANGQTYFNIYASTGSYGYLTHSIFRSTTSINILDNTSSNEGVALDRVKQQFYLSVRCIRKQDL